MDKVFPASNPGVWERQLGVAAAMVRPSQPRDRAVARPSESVGKTGRPSIAPDGRARSAGPSQIRQLAIMVTSEDDRPMAGSMTGGLLVADEEFPCPRCNYAIWVQYAEIVAQVTVLCPCCRVRVLLRDTTGSVQLAGEVMQRAQERLLRRLKGMGR
jgi:hypothetical protein